MTFFIAVAPATRLPRLPRRTIRARRGESLRDAELRWQSKADPIIALYVDSGYSKGWIATRVGVSHSAIINAYRRAVAKR